MLRNRFKNLNLASPFFSKKLEPFTIAVKVGDLKGRISVFLEGSMLKSLKM